MRILIFSDIHGNLPALEKLIKTESFDEAVFLGDAVNYGPWSNECVQLLNSLVESNSFFVRCLKGNHEEAYINGKYEGNGLAKRFFDFCYPSFTKHETIKKWNDEMVIGNFNLKHTIDNRVIYPDSQISFTENYIIGHSHHQSHHVCNGKELFVVGSAGQNRQHINCIDYMIWDDKKELKHIVYDENLIINEMKARKYPTEFIEYYSKKARL